MIIFKRSDENPVLLPNPDNNWEGEATFNGCSVEYKGKTVLLYRAESLSLTGGTGKKVNSSIGCAVSSDGIHFKDRHQFIRPEFDWEQFGCEDPRVTRFGKDYYIFYTALSKYPFQADGIKVALAITSDFKQIKEKHLVTNFNAKAMCLFPERIGGKIAAVLAANTDKPPVKIAVAYFDDESQIWSDKHWSKWYENLNSHAIPLERSPQDQIEVGAPPIKTKYGWLLIYSHIQNFNPPAVFGVEAALLNLNNPAEVLARTKKPLLIPREQYERYGRVPNIVFPTGAMVKGKELRLYYGAADTTCALATIEFEPLLHEILGLEVNAVRLKRFIDNPIISPIAQNDWEAQATFNAAAIYEKGRVHIVYRAMSNDNTSVLGYASSADGTRITERLPNPIYVPRKEFEAKFVPGGNSGCEDPRITRIDDELYMLYTAYNGRDLPRVAMTHIKVDDFLNKQWKNWADPVLISPPGMDDKDAALFPRKIKGKYAILHRLGTSIWIDFVDDLNFDGNRWIYGQVLMEPTPMPREHKKIGIAGPPIETPYGWLLFCHGVTVKGNFYDIKAALLGLDDPLSVIGRTYSTIMDPETDYERNGIVNNVVFSCGATVIGDTIYFYYGGADKVIGVATVGFNELVDKLRP